MPWRGGNTEAGSGPWTPGLVVDHVTPETTITCTPAHRQEHEYPSWGGGAWRRTPPLQQAQDCSWESNLFPPLQAWVTTQMALGPERLNASNLGTLHRAGGWETSVQILWHMIWWWFYFAERILFRKNKKFSCSHCQGQSVETGDGCVIMILKQRGAFKARISCLFTGILG